MGTRCATRSRCVRDMHELHQPASRGHGTPRRPRVLLRLFPFVSQTSGPTPAHASGAVACCERASAFTAVLGCAVITAWRTPRVLAVGTSHVARRTSHVARSHAPSHYGLTNSSTDWRRRIVHQRRFAERRRALRGCDRASSVSSFIVIAVIARAQHAAVPEVGANLTTETTSFVVPESGAAEPRRNHHLQ